MTKKMKKNVGIGKQTICMIFGKILALISTLAIPFLLTRFISKEEYGLYAQFNTITLFVTSIFSFGIQTNLYYFFPNETSENKSIFVFQTYLMLFVLGILAIILFQLPLISNLLTGGGQIYRYKYFITTAIILMMPTLMLEALYVVKKDIITSIFYPSMQSFLKIALILVSLFFFSSTVKNVFIAVLISMIIPFLFSIYYLIISLNCQGSVRLFSINKLIMQMRYSVPYGCAVFMNAIIRRIDKILCISYLSTTEYAIYSIAFIGVPGIQQIYDSISQVIMVKLVEAVKLGKKEKVLELYKELVLKAFSYTIPIIFIVIWHAKEIIIFFFTVEYADATPLFQIYLISFIVGIFGSGVVLRATGKTKLTFKAYAYSGILVVPLSFLLISKFGMRGAISTAMLGALLPKIIILYMEIKIIGCRMVEYFPWKDMIKITAISIVALVPVVAIDVIFKSHMFAIFITSIFYLLLVISFEIKYGLFIIDKAFILSKINLFKNKMDDTKIRPIC